jgi:hypothetical protein
LPVLPENKKMSHSHGEGCSGGHDHGGHDHGVSGLQGEEFGIQYSLYQKIDLENVSCLNEEIDDSGKTVFKAWEDRKNRDQVRNIFKCKVQVF